MANRPYRFYEWLTKSDFGTQETGTTNNHGTFADMQRAGLALFLDRNDEAREIAEGFKASATHTPSLCFADPVFRATASTSRSRRMANCPRSSSAPAPSTTQPSP